MKIEINLLPGAKKKRGGGVGAGISLPNLKDILTQVKDPLLLGAIGAWAAGLTMMGMIWFTEQGRIASLEPQLSAAQREARQFQIMIAEKTRTQVLRDSLEAELTAIRGIDGVALAQGAALGRR